MASLRSSGASKLARVAAIGLCALPLAAGYADARSPDPSHGPSQGRFSPQGRGGGPGVQGGPSQQGRNGGLLPQGRSTGLPPQGASSPKAPVSPPGEQAGGQLLPPGRHQGGARSPRRDPSQEGPAQQGGPPHDRHFHGGAGQEATSSPGDGPAAKALGQGSAPSVRSADHRGAGKQPSTGKQPSAGSQPSTSGGSLHVQVVKSAPAASSATASSGASSSVSASAPAAAAAALAGCHGCHGGPEDTRQQRPAAPCLHQPRTVARGGQGAPEFRRCPRAGHRRQRECAHGACRRQTGRSVVVRHGAPSRARRLCSRFEQSAGEARRRDTPADTRSGLEQADHHRAASARDMVRRSLAPRSDARAPAGAPTRDLDPRSRRAAGGAGSRGSTPVGRACGLCRL
jgi:hypothetical protein